MDVHQPLKPDALAVLQSFGVETARYALHETSDEGTLENIEVVSRFAATHSDQLPRRLVAALETAAKDFPANGYFVVQVSGGTITRLGDAVVLEVRCWKLDEATRRALIALNMD